MVPYADLILPDTTYLERWDCISLLDRPISERRRAGRCHPPAGGRARPRRAPLPGRADRPRRAARPARLRQRRRRAAISRRLSRLHRQPRARCPASARWPAGAARTAASYGARRAQPATSSSATSPTAASTAPPARGSATSSTPTAPIWTGRVDKGFRRRSRRRSIFQLYSSRCRSSASPPRGHGAVQPPDAASRSASRPTSIRCRSGIRRSRRRWSTTRVSPACHHPAADGHVSFLGLAERLAAADPRRATGSTCRDARRGARHRRRRLGVDHSRIGRVKAR